ncbi:hypothetical protein LOD99_3318 [Oopsacas minuta]|uniref:Uncharacterized protein n=1 Tax=Oopsacas minuta TaxID=111878 RepID=A0AAV7JZN1_9METZ|nr:hypothetical protein LOD99_3318 [Oopsacas minuta]
MMANTELELLETETRKRLISTISEPYGLLILKLCKQLESMEDCKPKTIDKLKNLLFENCYVTQFSAPFKLLTQCNDKTVQLKTGNKLIPKVFTYYECVKTGDEVWKISFHSIYEYLRHKINAFPLEIDESTYSKITSAVEDMIETMVANKTEPQTTKNKAKLRETLIRKCILTSSIDPLVLVHNLQDTGYIDISLAGEVKYNLDGIECGEFNLNTPNSYELYLLSIVSKLKIIQELPKTEQALVNVLKPFTHIIQAVQLSDIVGKYPQFKCLLKKIVKREFRLDRESWFENSSEIKKQSKGKVIRHGRGHGKLKKSINNQAINQTRFDVLLRSNEIIEKMSRKWNAPLSPNNEEEGIRRVSEWMEGRISYFGKGNTSSSLILIQQAMQCSLYRKLIPADIIIQRLEEYGIIRVQGQGNGIEYDFTELDNLSAAEMEINNILKADANCIAAFRMKLAIEGKHEKLGRSYRGKRRSSKRGMCGRGRGRGRRSKRAKY